MKVNTNSSNLFLLERAMSDSKSNQLIVVGGVGCNLRLQEKLQSMCSDREAQLGCMDERYCIDNGAMIAHTGYLMYNSAEDKSVFNIDEVYTDQRFRTDQVYVTWRD